MIYLAFFFTLMPSAKGSGAPWYPVMVPMGEPTHRHTTHVVTHPVVRTRVIVLREDKDEYRYGKEHHSKQQTATAYGSYSERDPRPNYVTSQSGNHGNDYYDDGGDHGGPPIKHHGGHSYNEEGDKGFDYNYHSQPEIKYSMLVSESPWKPLVGRIPNNGNHYYRGTPGRSPERENYRTTKPAMQNHQNDKNYQNHHHREQLPKGYLPLKYLGMDEEKVTRIVQQALNTIDNDMETAQHTTRPRYPTGIQDLIGPRVVRRPPRVVSPPLTSLPRLVIPPLTSLPRAVSPPFMSLPRVVHSPMTVLPRVVSSHITPLHQVVSSHLTPLPQMVGSHLTPLPQMVRSPITPLNQAVKPLPPMFRGAVFYDNALPQAKYVQNTPAYVRNYQIANGTPSKSTLKFNVECQCQAPY